MVVLRPIIGPMKPMLGLSSLPDDTVRENIFLAASKPKHGMTALLVLLLVFHPYI